MSIYLGDKPYSGIITERQWRQLQLMPELLSVLEDTLSELISYKQNYDATPNWPNPENDSETVQQARGVLAKLKEV